MAWIWTDEVARLLVVAGAMSEERAGELIARPIALRSDSGPNSDAEEEPDPLRRAA